MGSISKPRKTIDRISNLADNLISHILLFLTTKDAVRTSTLSTHWNQQWASITHLEFDDGSSLYKCLTPTSEASFVNFVYRVLLFKVSPVDVFRLRSDQDYEVTNVSQWVSAAISRYVREIDVTVPMAGRCFRPDLLFSSKSLVVLNLGVGFILRVPKIVSLESLNILHLKEVQFEDGESLSKLLSSCPVLEELKIKGVLCESVDVLNISSLALKRLILNGLYYIRYSEIDGAHAYKVALNTPSLEYLENVDDGVPDGYQIESTLHSLDRASLCLHLSSYQFDEYDDELILALTMADLAVAISIAFYRFDCVLSDFQLPRFPRLTTLEIGAIATDEGLSLLIAFLQSSPQLESLSFALEYEPELWDPPADVPFCMQHNLKVIELRYVRELEPGLSMVKYFVEKANCLEDLVIPLMKEKDEEFVFFSRKSYCHQWPQNHVQLRLLDLIHSAVKLSRVCLLTLVDGLMISNYEDFLKMSVDAFVSFVSDDPLFVMIIDQLKEKRVILLRSNFHRFVISTEDLSCGISFLTCIFPFKNIPYFTIFR